MANKTYGWMGKFLDVDLSKNMIAIKDSDFETLDSYLGGNGIGTKIVYDEVTPEIEAFDPRNVLVFAAGNLAGTKAFSSGLLTATSKSPIGNNMIASSQANGFFGSRLKFAGFDYIVIRGKSNKPVTIKITDNHAELVDASHLVGLDALETAKCLRETFNEKKVSVAVIGGAGEKKSLLSGILVDDGHFIGSGALGAVMGAKNLKGIAVSGSQEVPVFNSEKLTEMVKAWANDIRQSQLVNFLRQSGTAGTVGPSLDMGDLIAKNGSTSIGNYEDLSSFSYRSRHKVKVEPCYKCPLNHCREMTLLQGPGKGIVMDEPEFEGIASIGSNLGITDGDVMLYLHSIVDREGLDVRKVGSVIGLCMECYEIGLLSIDQLDDIDLTWGNYKSVVKLIDKIVKREGIGDVLADGIIPTAEYIGGDAKDRALHGKNGAAYHTHDLRVYFDYGLGHIISSYCGTKEGVGVGMVPDTEVYAGQLNPHTPEKKAYVLNETADREGVCDLIGLCHFAAIYDVAPSTLAGVFNAVTGQDYTYSDLMKIYRKNRVLARAYSCRHGMTAKDDTLSKRFLDKPFDGPNVDADLRKHMEEMKNDYYDLVGFDKISGKPLPDTLKNLGLDFVIKDLWS
ncbi:aldehyde ferredoxin oxidoreductase family protein [Acidaminobacter sp. JC074]|uniref:aldehyde ferredoxin oxidoreductase family protein n=1 Tax=Acidaminobacter sp. JC074 TaxID=2530199 RepID=UPI001F0E4582|nr:aldehyde ferredoxin oxidoreductase C-terminal domain-containing protein [Acidaminobacter sp. JC074]